MTFLLIRKQDNIKPNSYLNPTLHFFYGHLDFLILIIEHLWDVINEKLSQLPEVIKFKWLVAQFIK